MKPVTALLWILSLAFVAVGARNFELGLSLDAPIYATIARNIARTGEWFYLDCQIPDFVPFAEHPHLGFWMMALWLKFFPAADWAVRVPGHLMYVLFLMFLFHIVRRRSNEAVAVWTIVLLWSFHLFSNIFSTFYLDPGVLLMGSLSVFLFEKGSRVGNYLWSALAGVLMGACLVYKGLTLFGFIPALILVAATGWYRDRSLRSLFLQGATYSVAFLGVALLYYLALKRSSVPEFLDIYFSRQVANRFARKWSVWEFFSGKYWWQLFTYTNFLMPLALLSLRKHIFRASLLLPWALSSSFIFMFSTSGLAGGQYLIMVLPWLAWLIAEGALQWIKVAPIRVAQATGALALAAVCLIQYLPFVTHGQGPSKDILALSQFQKRGVHILYLELAPMVDPFVISGSFAWYADLRVRYIDLAKTLPSQEKGVGFYSRVNNTLDIQRLSRAGWCEQSGMVDGTFWLPCSIAY